MGGKEWEEGEGERQDTKVVVGSRNIGVCVWYNAYCNILHEDKIRWMVLGSSF